MAVLMKNVDRLIIPEGEVSQIKQGTLVLWERNPKVYIFRNGNTFHSVTGGYTFILDSYAERHSTGEITSSDIKIKASSNTSGLHIYAAICGVTNNPINVNQYSKIGLRYKTWFTGYRPEGSAITVTLDLMSEKSLTATPIESYSLAYSTYESYSEPTFDIPDTISEPCYVRIKIRVFHQFTDTIEIPELYFLY